MVASRMDRETFDIRVSAASSLVDSRLALRHRLSGWGCANVDDIVLVFSELVTNGILHTPAAPTAVVTHLPPLVRLEVRDVVASLPERQHDGGVGGGVGLQIVGLVSEGWGWDPTPAGKLVWCLIACGH